LIALISGGSPALTSISYGFIGGERPGDGTREHAHQNDDRTGANTGPSHCGSVSRTFQASPSITNWVKTMRPRVHSRTRKKFHAANARAIPYPPNKSAPTRPSANLLPAILVSSSAAKTINTSASAHTITAIATAVCGIAL